MEWVVISGRSVEEAKEIALDQLGVDESDAEIEVIQEAQKGLFGRLRVEAQVRARVRPTAPRPKIDRRDRRRRDRNRRRGGGGGQRERGNGGAGATTSPSAERATPTTAGGEAAGAAATAGDGQQQSKKRRKRRSRSRRRRSGTPRTAEGATVSETTQSTEQAQQATLDLEGQRAAVEAFLTRFVEAFGRPDATVTVTTSEEEQTIEAAVDGPELGLLVGPKGATLQALQELVRSVVQRRFVGQPHARVRVDVASYRARRKAALERFAREVAESVKETGVAKALDPMGAADRKVVHDVVNEIDGVTTVSEGQDENRRVIIRPV